MALLDDVTIQSFSYRWGHIFKFIIFKLAAEFLKMQCQIQHRTLYEMTGICYQQIPKLTLSQVLAAATFHFHSHRHTLRQITGD